MKKTLILFSLIILFAVPMGYKVFASDANTTTASPISMDNGKGGEIFGGNRNKEFNDPNEWLTLKAGDGGVRIVSKDGSKEIMLADNYGGIYLNGDLFLNNEKVNNKLQNLVTTNTLNNFLIIVLAIFAALFIVLLLMILKSRKEIEVLKQKVAFEQKKNN